MSRCPVCGLDELVEVDTCPACWEVVACCPACGLSWCTCPDVLVEVAAVVDVDVEATVDGETVAFWTRGD